MVKSSGLIPL